MDSSDIEKNPKELKSIRRNFYIVRTHESLSQFLVDSQGYRALSSAPSINAHAVQLVLELLKLSRASLVSVNFWSAIPPPSPPIAMRACGDGAYSKILEHAKIGTVQYSVQAYVPEGNRNL